MNFFLKHKWYLLFLLYIPFFFIAYFLYDPDFPWHFQMGNYIIHHGIPKTDPFSYTMPTYPFIDHEWLTNVLLYVLKTHFTYTFLALLFPLFALFSQLVQVGKKWKVWTPFLLLLTTSIMINFSGVRVQVLSWLLISLLYCILVSDSLWEKYKYILPLCLVLWVNLHASFAFGIIAIFITVIIRSFISKKRVVGDGLVFFACLFATCINPYGIRIWKEIADQIIIANPRWFISEWYPGIAIPDVALWTLVVLSFSFAFRYKKKLSPVLIGLFLVTFLMSVSAVRQVPLWVLTALPLTNQSFQYLLEDLKKIKGAEKRFFENSTLFFLFLCTAFFYRKCSAYQRSISAAFNWFIFTFPCASYIKTHPTTGNIFALYEWGGYLELYYPQKREFIDGRMPSWNWKAPLGEANSAFYEYLAVLDGRLPFSYIQKKYHIDTVLFPNFSNKDVESLHATSVIGNLFQTSTPKNKTFDSLLRRAGMKKVYEDSSAIVYRK